MYSTYTANMDVGWNFSFCKYARKLYFSLFVVAMSRVVFVGAFYLFGSLWGFDNLVGERGSSILRSLLIS